MKRVRLPASGTHVDLTSVAPVLSWLAEPHPTSRVLLGHNLHSLYLCEKSPEFRELYLRADVVIPDGFPVWLAARLRARVSKASSSGSADRIGSTDWLARLDEVPQSLRIALIGADGSSNIEAVKRLSDSFPQHHFSGWDGYEGRLELEDCEFRSLVDFDPDLVLVGMGMPFQEEWLARHWHQLPTATFCVVGGAIDQISGSQRLAPRHLGPLGLEWIWRLASDPRRLSGRYLIEPFKLSYLLLRKLWIREQPRARQTSESMLANESD